MMIELPCRRRRISVTDFCPSCTAFYGRTGGRESDLGLFRIRHERCGFVGFFTTRRIGFAVTS
jgi:hypothetical protein